ncbi:T9SS type A sorting domain-containing protein [Flavobacterium macrobrachii]|uniref:T9SS type A sorting domain-containing protein n=1 Tax=Flavobacterium macrobrachii TaxID=591204 RepID=A0ABS2CSQ5_9FLAO|nr:T9SS type A sorting domain-containing protein [Flavobacterium macrobrachii]MBM6498002.1 T9SS type A sorting domain-containing protein [Flavobacterium macrobrachii]
MKTIKLIFFICFFTNTYSQCISSISAGDFFTIAIKTDNSLWAWGRPIGGNNLSGAIPPTQIGTATNWQKVSAGMNHVLAIKNDGTLWAWGQNSNAQVGDGTTIIRSTPIQIGTANNWMSISAGSYHSIALKTDGTLWAWGAADNGPDLLTPTQIGTANDWVKIETNDSNTLALKTNGTLWYLIGNDVNNFNQVGNSNNWQDFSINVNSNWGIKTDGTLWRFNTGFSSAVQEGTDNNWISVSAGQQYVIIKKSNNTIWCKGTNTYGQLGTGNNLDINTLPIQIGTNSDWNKISAARFHTLLLNNSNNLYSMGYNGSGALGDGTYTDKNTPILFNCSTLGITVFDSDSVSIYPNPCKDFLSVELKNESKIDNVTIIDISGKILLVENNVSSEIDLTNFKTGVYVIKINSNEKVIYKKIVKN